MGFHGSWVDHVQEREETTYRRRVEDMGEEDMSDADLDTDDEMSD